MTRSGGGSALKAAGIEVATAVTTRRRPARGRAGGRAGRARGGRAGRGRDAGDAAAAAGTTSGAADDRGYPVRAAYPDDHYSAGRDRRYRDRMGRTSSARSRGWARPSAGARASAAGRPSPHREAVPVTLRRIAKLEADARRIERAMGVQEDWYWDRDPGHQSYRFSSSRAAPGGHGRGRARRRERPDRLLAAARRGVRRQGVGTGRLHQGDFVHGRWGGPRCSASTQRA